MSTTPPIPLDTFEPLRELADARKASQQAHMALAQGLAKLGTAGQNASNIMSAVVLLDPDRAVMLLAAFVAALMVDAVDAGDQSAADLTTAAVSALLKEAALEANHKGGAQ